MLFFSMIHMMVLVSILISYAPWWIKIPAIVACIVSFIYVTRRYVLLNSNNAVVKLMLDEQQWRLLYKDGRIIQANLKGNSIVLPFVSILNFKPSLSVLLTPGSMATDQYRQLCVYIRTNKVIEEVSRYGHNPN